MGKSYFMPRPNTLEELNTMYRELAKKYHPDVGGNNAIMQEINNEYDKLKTQYKTGNNEPENFLDFFGSAVHWMNDNHKKSEQMKETTAKIREFVKTTFPDCKFSCKFEKHIIMFR